LVLSYRLGRAVLPIPPQLFAQRAVGDAQEPGGLDLVALGPFQRLEDRAALEFLELKRGPFRSREPINSSCRRRSAPSSDSVGPCPRISAVRTTCGVAGRLPARCS